MNCNTARRRSTRSQNSLVAPFFGTLLNEVFQSPVAEAVQNATVSRRPAANISKSEDAFYIKLAVPGVSKEDITIKVEGHQLTVSSNTTSEENEFRLREFDFQNFSRSFTLPKNVSRAEVAASYDAGILTVTLPIAPEAKPRKVQIK